MGAAKEHRFAKLNREHFDVPLGATCLVEKRHWDFINTSLSRTKEELEESKRTIAALTARLERAAKAFRCLEESRNADRLMLREKIEIADRAHALTCGWLESARGNAAEMAAKYARAMEVIKYAMPAEEYHRIMAILFDDYIPPNTAMTTQPPISAIDGQQPEQAIDGQDDK
jgi:hypothetical protein